MSVPIPPILQTHISFLCQILSAFPVHFPAFPHKTNNTLSCPQRKKRTKTSKGTLYCPVHSLSVYTKEPIYCPQIRFPHINGAKKGTIICPLIMSPYPKGTIYYPLMHCLSARKGQYYVPLIFAAFPHVFHKRDNILPPLIYFPSFT